ncbi:glycoside hydrolase family 3 protein [Tabrizicola sp.]|uniref:glycoside hydrolase family 3 N-terminal domain-containing protein n=1 Tax=Tabrizicola sp. TaxID=2005166 RepID=UPI0027371ED8|nr:glycoside hydrolase family 3 protein [Tabrizicola sp.]MDP3194477.1 glycoside hydrolase family 3 protein [Tabrizicola sp.]
MTVGQGAVIFGCAGPTLLPEECAFFRDADPFGFILFARNVEDPDQVRRLTSDLREAVGWQAPILVDQEGGRVQRLRAPHWREWTPPLDTVDGAGSVEAAERVMRLRASVIAAELREVGIDADCIPTLDVVRPATHPFLMNRCYGRDPETVARIGRAVAEGLMAGGVLPVMKHMPGHGLSHVDTHHDLPTVDVSVDELTLVDFAPFRALRDLPMAMTAHLVFAALDAERPATQSPTMIRVIREEIGFQGLLMSDDLNMQALSGTLAERTARTIAAGVDIALHCKGDMAEMVAVAGAAGVMGPKARARAEAAVAARRPATVDVEAALSELAHG